MAEACPSRARIEAFGSGRLRGEEAASLEGHLNQCLKCGEHLEAWTRGQLDRLVGPKAPEIVLGAPEAGILESVIQRVEAQGPTLGRFDPERIFDVLEKSGSPNVIGSFAGFDVLEIAGSGAMGVVLKAVDPTLDRVVAIKVIFPLGSTAEAFVARFLEEARALAALRHDGIVTVHHAGMFQGLAYLIMPFHEEGNLETWLRHHPKSNPTEVARVGRQLADALAATHATGILHRDIKPSNILLEGGLSRVRLADFGLAQPRRGSLTDCESNSQHSLRVVAGTPQFMSPEQARGEPIDARSDLFGLGAVLFQMVSGRTLYSGGSSREVLAKAERCELKPIRAEAPELSVPLSRIIDRLLAKRREDRFGSAAEVVLELDRLIASTEKRSRPLRRFVVGSSIVLAVVAMVFFWLEGSGRSAVVNTLLCRRSGNGYFVRGRFGSYSELSSAIQACPPNGVVELAFSGERRVASCRLGGRPITLRAGKGFAPVLVAASETQPLLLADAPLALEGVTLMRRSNRVAVSPLISVEGAPVFLLNCRIARMSVEGETMLVRGGRLLPVEDASRIHKPLIRLSGAASLRLRNSLIAARVGSAIGLWGMPPGRFQITTEDCLFVIHRAFAIRCDAGTQIDLTSIRSAFVSPTLVDLDEAGLIERFSAHWENCLFDCAEGAILRLNQYGNGAWPGQLEWKETGVIYNGDGSFLLDRRGRGIETEKPWNELMKLSQQSHQVTHHELFSSARARSSQQLAATDLDLGGFRSSSSNAFAFSAQFVGEGDPYVRFQQEPDYIEWIEQFRIATAEWLKRPRTTRAESGG